MTTSASILERISAVMRVERFFPPATPQEVDEVEQALGVPFPDWLRELYLACNGFSGPTGVRYLYELKGRNGVANFNPILREEWADATWLKRAIVFADNGCGGSITVHWAALDGKVIEWCYGDDGEYRQLDLDLFEVWAREQRRWDALEGAT